MAYQTNQSFLLGVFFLVLMVSSGRNGVLFLFWNFSFLIQFTKSNFFIETYITCLYSKESKKDSFVILCDWLIVLRSYISWIFI